MGNRTTLACCSMIAAAAVLLTVTAASASFEIPVEGRRITASSEPAKKKRRLAVRATSDTAGFFPNPEFGVTEVSVSEVLCVPGSAGEFCIATATSGSIELDPTLWTALGDPPGSDGYRYRDRDGSRGGVRGAVISGDKLLLKARGDDWPLVPTGAGNGVQVRVLRNTLEICARFGGVEKRNQPGLLRFARAEQPAFCGAACGNGRVERGEGCDPPDGSQCSLGCRLTCTTDPGSTLVACSSSDDGTLAFAGDGDDYLLAWTDVAREGNRLHAVRLDAAGQVGDAPPLELSDGASSSLAPLAVIDEAGFYVLWTGGATAFASGRRIPRSGLDFGPIEGRASNGPLGPGQCFDYGGPPLGLGANPYGGNTFVSTAEYIECVGVVYLVGVPGAGFLIEPPYTLDSPPAAFASSATEAAAVWVRIDDLGSTYSLQANWMDLPGHTPSFQLTSLPAWPAEPAVAAVDDTFLAVWSTGTAIRGTRFVHPGSVLDGNGGFLIANATGTAALPQVAAEAGRFVVAWRDRVGGSDRVRTVRVETDGTVVAPGPLQAAEASSITDLGLAAGTTSAWVAFSTAEPNGAYAMRIAPVP